MNSYLCRCLILLVPSFLAMLYGIIYVFPRTQGLYFRMGTMGMACLFAGYLSSLTTYLTDTSYNGVFSVSSLGTIGFSLFLLAQNSDSVASVMYRPDKKRKKDNITALLAPFVIIAIFAAAELISFNTDQVHGLGFWAGTVILPGTSTVINAVTAYYTARYSIAPDEEFGLITFLRPYNASVTVLLVLLIPEKFIREISLVSATGTAAVLIYYLLLVAGILAVIPLMERGRSKFLTLL